MEYVFGTEGDHETLRTKGGSHTDLNGYQQVERQYGDQAVTDSFYVVEKARSAEDEEGNCYDWYVIDHHYRYTDKFTPQIKGTEQEITELEITAMEQEQMITENEIAILELKERMGI